MVDSGAGFIRLIILLFIYELEVEEGLWTEQKKFNRNPTKVNEEV